MGYNIIVYGSLLNKSELDSVFDVTESEYIPVKIEGFKRSFNQSVTWREGENGERGVLTVFPDENAWINAVIVQNVPEKQFEAYCQREQGYTIVTVPSEKITPYSADSQITQSAEIAVGVLWLDSVEPVPEYKELCLEGAKFWGDEFYSDFIETTVDSADRPDTEIDIFGGFSEPKFSDLERQ